eukprot:NODE_1356_length_893_cov_109.921671_g1310_i0.p1 GENE.NODE_1356_length_893_cov_109.921671_g1310_i0~~NODE_1356_length_893_cov_109.921671_g1310_i0.p1  ORF type:complete len:261 (+),score=19.10 NODE_1356_length_893_cov_109.921671_g1310_i0:89-871(+)
MAAGRKLESMEGQRVPLINFHTMDVEGKWVDVSSSSIFEGKTVVVFSLPGAFTTVCSGQHVPRFNELAPVFKSNGIDDIVCISVNDTFVMSQWQKAQGADNIRFLPDGNGEFTEGMGMLVDNASLGPRSWRYSMLVRDGVVKRHFIEPDEPGDPYKVSDADTMLKYVNYEAHPPPDIVIITRAGCQWCQKSKEFLDDQKLEYEELLAPSRRFFRAVSAKEESPQVFINGKLIGGFLDLQRAFADKDFLFDVLGYDKPPTV